MRLGESSIVPSLRDLVLPRARRTRRRMMKMLSMRIQSRTLYVYLSEYSSIVYLQT